MEKAFLGQSMDGPSNPGNRDPGDISRSTPPSLLTRFLREIEDGLLAALDGKDGPLWMMLRYHMGWIEATGEPSGEIRGKCLRPTVCLFTAEEVAGDWRLALPVAIALELTHNFSLIHDDIQDDDRERHHRETVWSVWGKPRAIVAGNVMRCMADAQLQKMVATGTSYEIAHEIFCVLARRYMEMINGQVLDVTFERRIDVSTPEYLEMIAMKTGAMFSAAMELGAMVSSNNIDLREHFRVCGSRLGRAFQLRDDFLGVWGDGDQLGKPVGADIRQRKKSFPAVYALQFAEHRDAVVIRELYESSHQLTDRDVSEVLEIMDRTGARSATQARVAKECDDALAIWQDGGLSIIGKRQLEELAQFILCRAN